MSQKLCAIVCVGIMLLVSGCAITVGPANPKSPPRGIVLGSGGRRVIPPPNPPTPGIVLKPGSYNIKSQLIHRPYLSGIGEVDSNKGKIPFRLIDETVNGCFNDRWLTNIFPGRGFGDCIWFDWKHTGQCPFHASPYTDVLTRLYGVNSIDGKLYILTPDEKGKVLKVALYTGPTTSVAITTGKIGKVPLGIRTVFLRSDRSEYSVTTNGQPVSILPGNYNLDLGGSAKYQGTTYYFRYQTAKSFPASSKTANIKMGGKLHMIIGKGASPIRVVKGELCDEQPRLLLQDGASFSVHRSVYDPLAKKPNAVLKDLTGKVVGTSKLNDWYLFMKVEPDNTGKALGKFNPAPDFIKNVKPGRYTVEVDYDAEAFGGKLRATAPVVLEAAKPGYHP